MPRLTSKGGPGAWTAAAPAVSAVHVAAAEVGWPPAQRGGRAGEARRTTLVIAGKVAAVRMMTRRRLASGGAARAGHPRGNSSTLASSLRTRTSTAGSLSGLS